jgi:predicted MFS family arabinose efflux permease/membrane-associated phospholipid phosphatase
MSVMAVSARTRPPRAAAAALWAFAAVAIALGAGRAVTTTYVPVLLERIADRPGLIGAVMLVNAAAGFIVPIASGLWSDRRGSRGPFILGGSIVAAGGLVAIALGSASSYAVLALAAATVYIGLNAASTAHRALVAERFAPDRRAAATGTQEGAMLVGALAGTLAGGALIDGSAAALFVLWALALPLLALPTLAWNRAASPVQAVEAGEEHGSPLRLLREVLRRDGARQILVAQVLWVGSYAALAPFMVLYAEEVLGLGAAAAGALLAAFGLLTGVGMLVGARMSAERLRGTLLAGVALLGAGLLVGVSASNVAQGAVPFAAAALGAGLVSAVGFPYFTSFVPEGQAGRYAGAFFSARAISSAAALPIAGGLIAATGSYRALLGMGVLALAALVPLARAERRRAEAVAAHAPIRRLTAVIPVFRSDRVAAVTAATLPHVYEVVLVDDGAPPEVVVELERAASDPRVRVVRMGVNQGKGSAVAAGISAALADDPDAVIVLDSDGQHPPELIPAFATAARHADVVIGDRRRAGDMPWSRRLANGLSSWVLSLIVRRRLRDTQNGMRLFRADALRAAEPPSGRYEAETRHLKALVRSGQEVGWVPMPVIYDGEPSSFHPVRDTLRVMRAMVAPAKPGGGSASALWQATRQWGPRIGLGMVLAWTVAAVLPLLQPLDQQLFLAINGLGDGPEWLYQALDPHSRNYLLLAAAATLGVIAATRSLRYAGGALLAMAFAGIFADVVLEVIQFAINRPRPEEALGAEVMRSHGRHWAHIPSFPSGHLIVTTALVAAAAAMAPRLRYPLLGYLAAVAVTRMTFGAHFPLDVLLGTIIGWQVGMFAVALTRAVRLLPEERATPWPQGVTVAAPEPAPA